MAEIYVLDKHTAELIAAGEVVERPASVVKELTENAIDAGATNITVAIEHGGVSLIQIVDNGSGVDAEYIPTAFVRHATSKIRTQDDLEHICTLGFRGEALASVASVARVELLTRTQADEFACVYRISGGTEEGLEAAARPVGTTITVRDLFYNTPARMKFLKKDTSEANYVSDVVTQLALSHPEISFKFMREGKTQFQTPGDGKLRGAIYAALSRDFAQDLLDVDWSAHEHALSVTGCVTPPKSGRASRSMQFFFLNGRFVKNRTMMAALENAYKGMMMQGKYPGCVLFMTMPPHLVDVNVHPAKTEVRFAHERDVFDAVYQAVKNTLLTPKAGERIFRFAGEGNIERAFDKAHAIPAETPDLPPAVRSGVKATESVPDEQGVPVGTSISGMTQNVSGAGQEQQWEVNVRPRAVESFGGLGITPQPQQIKAYHTMVQSLASDGVIPYTTQAESENSAPLPDETAHITCAENVGDVILAVRCEEKKAEPTDNPEPQQTEFSVPQAEQTPALQLIGEAFHTYIVAQRDDEICFIDKHAAHERILYEKLAAQRGGTDSQMLLCPVTVQLSAEEKNALLEHQTLLLEHGVDVDDFGAGAVVIRAVPADIVPPDAADLVVELAARLVENPRRTETEKMEWVLHSIACRAAIKAGDKTHPVQLLRLAQDILDGIVPPFCPHGRPAILKVTKKELEKQFGRQG